MERFGRKTLMSRISYKTQNNIKIVFNEIGRSEVYFIVLAQYYGPWVGYFESCGDLSGFVEGGRVS
jgi:hypothetical protein